MHKAKMKIKSHYEDKTVQIYKVLVKTQRQ